MKRNLLLIVSLIFTSFGFMNAQNALNFDGSNDVVQTTFSGVLGSTDRTFEAWINVSTTAPSSNLTITDYGLNAVGSRNTFLVDGNRGIRFVSGGTNANISSSTGVVTAGQWTHVAFVMDNGTGFLYVNGVQVGTGSLTTVNTPSGNANLTIGQRVSGGSIPFSGSIDEVRIWDVARTPAEIMANMNSELCSYPSSLAAYYKLNQGIAAGNNAGLTNVIDEIANTATANNFAMTGAVSNWVSGAAISSTVPFDLGVTLDTLTQTISSNDTSSNVRYQWYDCLTNSILVGDTNRTYSLRSAGMYSVILSNGNCIDTTACVSTTFTPGIPGEALHFDGIDDYVQTTFPGVLDSANRTFEAWINVSTTAPSSNLTILDYGLNAIGSRNTFIINAGRAIGFISGGTNANISSTAGIITAGQWAHVAFVLDNGTGYLYLNGNQVGTGSLSSVNTPSGNADVTIGQRVSGGSIPFAGIIDEVRIWDVARTPSEIMANMNLGYCGPTAGLVAYYDMDNGVAGGDNTSITKVFNSINSGDGFLTNFALTGTSSNFDTSGINISLPLIDTTINQSGLNLMANDSTADAYQWFDCMNNLTLTSDTLRSFSATANGDYAVILSKNGCVDTSNCISIMTVGLDDLDFKNNFTLSQNPVNEQFVLINNNGIQVDTYLRSVSGRLVDTKQKVQKERIEFNTGRLTSGIYILSIIGNDGSSTNIKIVKR